VQEIKQKIFISGIYQSEMLQMHMQVSRLPGCRRRLL